MNYSILQVFWYHQDYKKREQGTGNREQGTGNREQGTDKKHSFAPV
jgi:hypothetical protein